MAVIGVGNGGAGYPSAIATPQYTSGGDSNWANAATTVPDSNKRMDAEVLNDIIDELVATQTELGVNPSGAFSDVAARLASLSSGTVGGPGSSTDNAVTRWDGTTGALLQNSNVIIDDNNNLGVGTGSIGSGAVKNIIVSSGTAPSTSVTDAFAIWSADRNSVAGKAGLHIRSEDGTQHVISDLVGIGTLSPLEALEVNGALKLGTTVNTNNGTIRYTGTDVEARVGGVWVSLTTGSYTDEQAQDAVGTILTDSATIDFTYNDGTPSITASVINSSITYAKIQDVSATNRLLGRFTAGAGVVEEVGLATGLRFNTGNLDYDINSLTADGTPDSANDYVVTWDASATAHKKVLLSNLGGSLSGGAANKLAIWSSATTLTNDTDLHYNSTNNNLGIGTSTFGTNLKHGIALFQDGVTPTTNVTDVVQVYAVDETAGLTGLGIKGEDGTVHLISNQTILGSQTRGTSIANGLMIDMGTSTNGILEFRQTNVAHGITDTLNTSVYADFRQVTGGSGGLQIYGATELNTGVQITGLVTSTDTAKSTSAIGAVRIDAGKKSGTGFTTFAANENLVVMGDRGSGLAKWSLDAEGDTWQQGDLFLGGRAGVGSTSFLANGVGVGGIQLEGAGIFIQMSNAASIAHGVTTLVATSVFFDVRPIVANAGGVQMRAYTETNLATIISSVVVTDPASTKTTASDAALRFEFGKKVGTTAEAMAAGVNLVVFTDVFAGGLGTRWILDNDGDTWQTGSLTLDGSITSGGNTARSLTINRHTTGNTAGNDFTVNTGGATAGATDKVGGNTLIKSGIGTGNAVPSTFQVQTPAFKGASGTTDQTLVNRWLLNGTTNLTSGVAATLITIPLATLEQAGGTVQYTIDVSDGTDMLNLSGCVNFSAVNKGGTYTTNSSVIGTESLAKSDAGDTLVTSFTFNNGSNQTQLRVTATVTGITPTVFRIIYNVYSGAQQSVTLN
jgi:hypothetical protein